MANSARGHDCHQLINIIFGGHDNDVPVIISLTVIVEIYSGWCRMAFSTSFGATMPMTSLLVHHDYRSNAIIQEHRDDVDKQECLLDSNDPSPFFSKNILGLHTQIPLH